MMQLLQQKLLNSPGGFILSGIDAGLGDKMGGIDSSLGQQMAEIGVLHLEDGFVGTFGIARHGADGTIAESHCVGPRGLPNRDDPDRPYRRSGGLHRTGSSARNCPLEPGARSSLEDNRRRRMGGAIDQMMSPMAHRDSLSRRRNSVATGRTADIGRRSPAAACDAIGESGKHLLDQSIIGSDPMHT